MRIYDILESILFFAILFYFANGLKNIIMGRTWRGKINKEVEEILKKKKLL